MPYIFQLAMVRLRISNSFPSVNTDYSIEKLLDKALNSSERQRQLKQLLFATNKGWKEISQFLQFGFYFILNCKVIKKQWLTSNTIVFSKQELPKLSLFYQYYRCTSVPNSPISRANNVLFANFTWRVFSTLKFSTTRVKLIFAHLKKKKRFFIDF